MDLFKKRLEITDVIDITYEQQLKHNRELLEICFKKCGDFTKKELSHAEEVCLVNCSKKMLLGFIGKFYIKNEKKNNLKEQT